MLRCTVEVKALRAALAAVNPAVPGGRVTLPILKAVRLEVVGPVLKVHATNLDAHAVIEVRVTPGLDGSVCADHKALTATLKGATGDVALESTVCDNLSVRVGALAFTVPGFPEEEFPTLPDKPVQHFAEFAAEDWARLAGVAEFSSCDETRPSLAGVYVEPGDGSVLATATDGRRLAHREVKATNVEVKAVTGVILAPWLFKCTDKLKGSVRLYVAGDEVILTCGTLHVWARTLGGPFPNYRQVIPTGPADVLTFDKPALAASVKALLPHVDKLTAQVRFELPERPELTVNVPDGSTATAPLALKAGTTKVGPWAFNGRYLDAVLKATNGSDTVDIAVRGPVSAFVLTDPTAPRDYYLLMPLRLAA